MAVHPGIMPVGPAVPLGLDTGLLDESSIFYDLLPSLEDLQEMTAEDHGGDAGAYGRQVPGIEFGNMYQYPAFESPNVRAQSASATGSNVAASDPLSSPLIGRTFSHAASNHSNAMQLVESIAGRSSRSPGTTNSVILTPNSTHTDLAASMSDYRHLEEDETDENNLSPTSTNQTDSDYVHVSHPHLRPACGQQTAQMSSNRPPPSSDVSGVSDLQHLSRASSVAPSNSSFSGAQWGSFPSSGSGFMDHNQHMHGAHGHSEILDLSSGYVSDDNVFVPSSQPYTDDLLSNINMFNVHLPIRPLDGHQMFSQQYNQAQLQHQYSNTYAQHPRQPQYYHQQPAAVSGLAGNNYAAHLDIPSTMLPGHKTVIPTTSPNVSQVYSTPMQGVIHTTHDLAPTIPSTRTPPYPRPTTRPDQPAPSSRHVQKSVAAATAPVRRPLKPNPTAVQSHDPQSSQGSGKRQGGRQKGDHLDAKKRQQSSKMRKLTACWRCALQRDPCDEETPCKRCQQKAQKGQIFYIPCFRSKLPDFVYDFLPLQASMTLMHQKQTIEDCVNAQVREWDLQRPIDIYLTSGYGPALRWRVCEFIPASDELLGQFQYLQNPATGVSQRFQKYSPPFGLTKLDSGDSTHFENYLDQLLSPDYLWDFGWTCFEEETQVDPDAFQARLLDLICKLYAETQDTDLKALLKEIIRMMIITYIMGHTLTIVEDTLPSVLDSVKHSRRGQKLPHTSPRLANRQLKFFFAVIRNNIYEKILKWQQQTLHTSGKKEDTWLSSFCAMLGFAMVLEEVQRTIQIQADAKAAKNEMSYDDATTEASNACERIDDRFQLLVGLFQCKYRDKKWAENGSFGPQTPELKQRTDKDFLRQLRQLTEEKQEHLQSRKDVPFSLDNQCQYTSRLVARFLLPFLSLPRG